MLPAQAKDEPWFGYDKELLKASMVIMKEQLLKDLISVETYREDLKMAMEEGEIEDLQKTGPKISLLAKWLPRERSSLDKKLDFVGQFAAELFPSTGTVNSSWESAAKARYRKTVAELTSFLALLEVLLSAKKEEEIRFGMVASRATMVLTKTFLNENEKEV